MKSLFYSIIILIIGLMLTGCEIERFDMPTWNVTLNVPFMNENYYVSDLVDSVNFFPAPGNGIMFQTSGDIQSEEVGVIVVETNINTGNQPILSGTSSQVVIPFSDAQNGRELAYGVISSGNLRCVFSDINPALDAAFITFNEFVDANNQPLVCEYDGIEGTQEIDLSGYHLGQQNSDTIVSDIHADIVAVSSLPDFTDIGDVNIIISEMGFSHFRGRLNNYQIPMENNSSDVDIEYPWGADDAIEPQDATIRMILNNHMSFPCELHGDFYAYNNSNGRSATLPILDENGLPYVLLPAVNDIPSITEIEITEGVDSLLTIMPEHINLVNGYCAITNDGVSIGEVEDTDRITGEYIASAPFTFILYPNTITPKDSLEIEISSENRETIEKNINSAQMSLLILNKLPIGGEITIFFSDNPLIDIADPATWVFSRTAEMESALTNSAEQPLDLSLTHDEIMLFTNPKVYVKTSFRFDATDGPVTINASPADYVRVRSLMKVNVLMEEQ